MEINTTLLRERFVLRDIEREGDAPIVAMSNRLALPLINANGKLIETLIIRAQNMHSCLRMAAQILQDFTRNGPIFSRTSSFDFIEAWDRACSDYEVKYNIWKWVAVYHKGIDIFSAGEHHGFLNVIEKCDSKNPGNYDRSVKIAEDTFIKMGRKISISYEANIGMVMNVKPDIGRCGLIHRGAERNSTFNFTAEPKEEENVTPVFCLNIAAAFLEGLQLAYNIGITNDKIRMGLIKKFSNDEKQSEYATECINKINLELNGFDSRLKMKFRPEKPDFFQAIADAERFHKRIHEIKK